MIACFFLVNLLYKMYKRNDIQIFKNVSDDDNYQLIL